MANREKRRKQKEQILLHFKGQRFDLKTGNKEEIQLELHSLYDFAMFQVNRKLYICGGMKLTLGYWQKITDSFSIDYSGRMAQLRSMHQKRNMFTLSGNLSLLIALGGYDLEYLRTCERYGVDLNKWSGLPPLNTARYFPGSILLSSRRAFCFCGFGSNKYLNSIEMLQSDKAEEWKTLPLSDEIARTCNLAAAE